APPAVYAGGTAFTPGSGGQPYAVTPQSYAAQSAQPNEWYGPMKRGNMCTTHVDINHGYGYQSACKKRVFGKSPAVSGAFSLQAVVNATGSLIHSNREACTSTASD